MRKLLFLEKRENFPNKASKDESLRKMLSFAYVSEDSSPVSISVLFYYYSKVGEKRANKKYPNK